MDGSGGDAILVKAPLQYGQTYLGANISERLITVECCLVTSSAQEEEVLRQTLISTLNPLAVGDLIVYGETFEKMFPDVQVVDGPVFKDANYTLPDGILYFNFTVVVPQNFATDLNLSNHTLVEVEPLFEFILKFDDYVEFGNIASGNIVIDNTGDAEAALAIEIPGPVHTPTIKNLTTGEFIRIFTPIAANETMHINTGFGNKSVVIKDDNGNSRNAFHYIDLNSTFFRLKVGLNNVEFRAEVGNDTANIKIRYRKVYLGI